MIKTPLINPEKNISIQTAQDTVVSSVKRFEEALEMLAGKVEDSAEQFKIVKEIATAPKHIAEAVKTRAVWVTQTVKKNPASYAIAVASIVGAYWWLSSQKSHWELPKKFKF